MAKRFTDSEKFRNPWYRGLKPKHKCLWEYLLSECDIAGILELDFEAMQFHIGDKITQEDINVLGSRIFYLTETKVFIPSFVKFQQKEISYNNNAHKNIIKIFEKYGIPASLDMSHFESPSQAPPKPLPRGTGNSNGNGNSIGNSIGNSKEDNYEKENLVDVPDFIESEIWVRWIDFRKELKKPLKPIQARQQIAQLCKWHERGHDVNEILTKSIANGWQGLFEPKGEANGKHGSKGNADQELAQFLAR